MYCEKCKRMLFTKAFSRDSVEGYLGESERKKAVCLICRPDVPQKGRLKRKRTKEDVIDKMLSVLDNPKHDLGVYRGVDIEDVRKYFMKKTQEDKASIDLQGVFLSNCAMGLVQIYLRDPDGGGGTGVHPSVREFWHTFMFRGWFQEVAHEKDLNGMRPLYLLYRSMYAREEGVPKTMDEFATQSYKIRKLGKPIIQQCGPKMFSVIEGVLT